MGKEFDGHATILIADVDCTAAGKDLCNEIGVRGYPTIKHGDPSGLEDYKGGRDFSALKKFAEGMKPSCSPANIDLCDAEQTFSDEVDKLQKKYQQLQKEKEEAVDAVKESGLGLMKAVKAQAAKAEL